MWKVLGNGWRNQERIGNYREERRGTVGVRLRQEVNVKNKLSAAEMLTHHPEGHIEVERGHRLR